MVSSFSVIQITEILLALSPLAMSSVTISQATSKNSQCLPLTLAPSSPTNLTQALQQAAIHSPHQGIVYIESNGKESVQLYPDLLEEAQRIVCGLRKLGLKPQDKVIFQFDRNQDFIAAFWGCVLGGFVPVPIAIAPTYSESNGSVTKLHHAWQMLEQPTILTNEKLAPSILALSKTWGVDSIQIETIEELQIGTPDKRAENSNPDDLALLLLTSGSTGMPKGVMQSHRNLLSRSASTSQINNFNNKDISLNWMPLDHVGGLVMFHIRDVYLGCKQIHVVKEAILQNPLLWLDLIDRFKATITWAPNFAYALINNQAHKIQSQYWNLSSMRFILNAGEAIVAKTARGFLELLCPQGLPANAMRPAWGMSETSSAITFSNNFSLDSTADCDAFVEVGFPIPGISIRIVDSNDQVVEQETIGRLQVKGVSVTSGYYQNPELNREVFTEDGWFNTGDLGFLKGDNLTITGRAKDTIIVNGLNYYSHEIEAVVEEVEGVEVSYTAACAVRTPDSNSDKLAIFFHTHISEANPLALLLKDIRASIVKKIGLNPDYLIPVEKETIPKTEIGKIQRSQLSQRFIAGDFDSILKHLDIATSNGNTLPDWFYRPIWRPKIAIPVTTQSITGATLIFIDSIGLGTYLNVELENRNSPCIKVEIGDEFNKFDTHHYQINPKHAEHYLQLLASLLEDNITIVRILHLWTYQAYLGEIANLEALEESLDLGVYSLLFLTQSLTKLKAANHSVQLQVISSYSQPTSPDDKIASEKAPILGLVKTIGQEIVGLKCRHIDLPVDSVAVNAPYILTEIQTDSSDSEVAYRNGRRLIPRLEKVDLTIAEKQKLPFQAGRMYLLTGGLGGIGVEIAKYLLETYQARLLLVGRTQLPPRSTWETRIKQADVVAQKIEAYLTLEKRGGEIIYEAVDICDSTQLQQVVNQAQSLWQCELQGVIHSAGIYQEGLLVKETKDSFAKTLHPKVFGTWVLHQLIVKHPNPLFISFSSVSSFFGGAMVGAYSAANHFLDCFAHYQKHQCSIQSYCFNWSTWNEVGMSQGYRGKDALHARGYKSMSAKEGLHSFLTGLYNDRANLLIGLDGSKSFIQQHTEVNEAGKYPFSLECESPKYQRKQAATPAKTEVEKTIASIWKQVLNIDDIDLHDSFFDLGGNSLLVAQVTGKLQEVLHRDISMSEMFQYPTISSIAKHLDNPEKQISINQLRQSKSPTDKRRELIHRQQQILSRKSRNLV
ncbi:SDR family NAD(P)-dependent oxidoreductase [Kamptonema animale CS-326]|jgi:acyl-CoA synthetase (AMP-forming)/AMP-acid ligase II/acyl carrier protein/short-subunit dehydrogenase involved in D-alanine esterification of teichoic acids|uniref:SDR family NAD(P)-dependent oxidoreductase n=1 Tax=Kamptonema animale TaxID=92934 RepID=UPI00232DF8B1|nr:SDR family NAD(P)-dependent oxidoreductase [Kamptonema animale]MDB9511354.1 SDR family NAD(P)-dependent oxidoreductase [Kamptonema animale CS-326]